MLLNAFNLKLMIYLGANIHYCDPVVHKKISGKQCWENLYGHHPPPPAPFGQILQELVANDKQVVVATAARVFVV